MRSATRLSAQPLRSSGSSGAACCCCSARGAIQLSSAITFIFGVAFIFVGALVNQEVQGWGLRSVDLLGTMCIGTGALLLVLSLFGLCAARSGGFVPLFAYFVSLLVIISALLLSGIYAFVENARMRHFLRLHWAEIQLRIGLSEASADDEGVEPFLTFEEAVELMHRYLAVVGGIGFSTVSVLMVGFVAAMRQLGLRAIAMSLLVTLGLLGVVELSVAFQTYGGVPTATTYLLVGAAGVQLFCSATGICGFRWLNCECLFWSLLVLVFSAAGLAYVTVATYYWLRDADVDQPENLLLVFGVALVADFVMVSTLIFMLLLYCKRRSAFLQADHAHELHGEFSDYASRERTRGGRKKNKKLPVAEIAASSHL